MNNVLLQTTALTRGGYTFYCTNATVLDEFWDIIQTFERCRACNDIIEFSFDSLFTATTQPARNPNLEHQCVCEQNAY